MATQAGGLKKSMSVLRRLPSMARSPSIAAVTPAPPGARGGPNDSPNGKAAPVLLPVEPSAPSSDELSKLQRDVIALQERHAREAKRVEEYEAKIASQKSLMESLTEATEKEEAQYNAELERETARRAELQLAVEQLGLSIRTRRDGHSGVVEEIALVGAKIKQQRILLAANFLPVRHTVELPNITVDEALQGLTPDVAIAAPPTLLMDAPAAAARLSMVAFAACEGNDGIGVRSGQILQAGRASQQHAMAARRDAALARSYAALWQVVANGASDGTVAAAVSLQASAAAATTTNTTGGDCRSLAETRRIGGAPSPKHRSAAAGAPVLQQQAAPQGGPGPPGGAAKGAAAALEWPAAGTMRSPLTEAAATVSSASLAPHRRRFEELLATNCCRWAVPCWPSAATPARAAGGSPPPSLPTEREGGERLASVVG